MSAGERRWRPRAVRGGALVAITALGGAGACLPGPGVAAPDSIRGYDIVVAPDDSLGRAIGAGLRRRGFTVRDHVVGASRPAAYLLTFTFRESGRPGETAPPPPVWLYVRLADTRSGAIVAAVSAPLDSLGPSLGERARSVVDSLAAQAERHRPVPPT